MQKTRAKLSLISALLLGSLATCGAAPCGLGDSSSLLQQRAAAALTSHLPSASRFSVWSNKTALMAQLEEFNKEAEMHSEEEGIRFYETVWRLANLSGVSTEEKGLMLVQEAGKIFGGGPFDAVKESVDEFKKWTGMSQGISCYNSRFQILSNMVGAVFASIVMTKCHKTPDGKNITVCFSDGIENLRYILVSLQHMVGTMSYCKKYYRPGWLCRAALVETSANVAGIASASTAIGYKCPEYTGKLSKNGIRCTLGFGKSGIYLGVAIFKMYEIYDKWSVNTRNKDVAEELWNPHFYTGPPYLTFTAQLGAAVAWITQIIFLMMGSCGRGTNGKAVCNGEEAELVAYIAQTVTGVLNSWFFCADPNDRNDYLRSHQDTSDPKEETSVDMTRKSISIVPHHGPFTDQSILDGLGSGRDLERALSGREPSSTHTDIDLGSGFDWGIGDEDLDEPSQTYDSEQSLGLDEDFDYGRH